LPAPERPVNQMTKPLALLMLRPLLVAW
jgi:hypothetical protein